MNQNDRNKLYDMLGNAGTIILRKWEDKHLDELQTLVDYLNTVIQDSHESGRNPDAEYEQGVESKAIEKPLPF